MAERDMELATWSRQTFARFMASLGRRRQHVERVGALSEVVGDALGRRDRVVLVAAALVHDIGYAPELASTGFHPLDGARFVREAGHEDVARLVAHHSGARIEAQLRGIDDFLEEFPFADSNVSRALTYCDLTTGPDGCRVLLRDRVVEINRRYGPDDVVSRAINLGVPEFENCVETTEKRLADAGIVLSGSLAYPR